MDVDYANRVRRAGVNRSARQLVSCVVKETIQNLGLKRSSASVTSREHRADPPFRKLDQGKEALNSQKSFLNGEPASERVRARLNNSRTHVDSGSPTTAGNRSRWSNQPNRRGC